MAREIAAKEQPRFLGERLGKKRKNCENRNQLTKQPYCIIGNKKLCYAVLPLLLIYPLKEGNMGAGCMLGLNNPFPAPGADNVRKRRTSLAPPQGGGTLKKREMYCYLHNRQRKKYKPFKSSAGNC